MGKTLRGTKGARQFDGHSSEERADARFIRKMANVGVAVMEGPKPAVKPTSNPRTTVNHPALQPSAVSARPKEASTIGEAGLDRLLMSWDRNLAPVASAPSGARPPGRTEPDLAPHGETPPYTGGRHPITGEQNPY